MGQVLCFGDSNTYGYEPYTAGRHDYNERWTGILAQLVQKDGHRVIEEGLCGRTAIFDDPDRDGRNGGKLFPILLETHAPVGVAIIMLGTNDCKTCYHATAEDIGNGVRKLIRQARDYDPKLNILLVSPIHLGDDVWDGYDYAYDAHSVEVSKQLGDAFERVAKEENTYFMRASDYAKPSLGDRQHIDAEDHKKLAYGIYDKIKDIL